jgi:hypothetical protein
MTDQELNAVRELVYIASEIATCMTSLPDHTASQIAGYSDDSDSELARLIRAINAAGPLVYPAWGHKQADEVA